MTKPNEYSWKTSDGLSVYAQSWAPDGPPKAAVALIHGLGEHVGRYPHVAQAFVDAGYGFNAYDQRGHGKTGGPRLYAPSYEILMSDIDRHLEETRKRFPGVPLFLYGHSFGGSLALYYTLKRVPPLAGVIASSPGLGSGTPQPALKLAFGRLMNRLIPTLIIPTGFPPGGLSHDPAILEKNRADPLFQEGISVHLGLDILSAGDWIRSQTAFPLPLLIMQGTGDRYVDPHMTVDFANRLSGDVTLKLWDGCFHELHNEVEKDKVIATIVDWVETHYHGGKK